MSDEMATEPVWKTHLAADTAFDPQYHQNARIEIVSFLNEPPGVVLDVGCGGGVTGKLIKEKFPGTRVVGIELNPHAARTAAEFIDDVICENIDTVDLARRLPGVRMRFELGADRRVRFFLRDEDSLVPFLSSLRCYVHRVDQWWDEGLGRELFSAMALGLPVLCPRGSLCADSIDHGVDGLLYGSADEALARLGDLRNTPALAASLGTRARAKAAQLFDPSAIASAWRKLLRGDDQLPWRSGYALAPASTIDVAP